jgi:F-type H+-transporting ATPase subunit a
MAAGKELNPTEYIGHHLTHDVRPFLGVGGFWSLHIDSVAVSIMLGFVGIGFLWWVVRGATAGVPNKRQAFVELLVGFVDEQAKGIFRHGDRNAFVAPAALTVFVSVLLMNAMDFLPVDIIALGTHGISEHGFRIVPTADVNTTFALALSV